MVHEGPQERARRLVANGISKKWAIARRNKCPRGFENQYNACYRIGTLQPLLHLPKFVNWIRTHNDGRSGWPCRADDENRALPEDELTREVLMNVDSEIKKSSKEKMEDAKRQYTGCVPCILKRLVIAYWGKELIKEGPPFEPERFSYDHAAVSPLHRLAQRWFCVNPPGLSDTLDELPESTSKAVRDKMTRDARENNMVDQQDTEEFQRRIFGGIEESYDIITTDGALRHDQYNSLFTVHFTRTHTCVGEGGCGGHPEIGSPENDVDLGLKILPDPTGTDTIADAIDRSMRDTLGNIHCSACKQRGMTVDRQASIASAPEYLRIFLALFDFREVLDKKGNRRMDKKGLPLYTNRKNMNPIAIPDILDLTQYMDGHDDNTRPVLYKLVSATYHAGQDLHAGHYVSGVTGPRLPKQKSDPPRFWCNDESINLEPSTQQNLLTRNPVERDKSRYDPYLLWYERMPPKTERAKGAVSAADRLAMTEATVVPRQLRSGKVRVS